MIFGNDHRPPHVHVFGPGCQAGVTLDWSGDWARRHAPAYMRGRARTARLHAEWRRIMADELDLMIARAENRGRAVLRDEPHARSAHYDAASGRVVELTNDCSFTFPARKVEGLENAGDEALAAVEILGLGFGLHWESARRRRQRARLARPPAKAPQRTERRQGRPAALRSGRQEIERRSVSGEQRARRASSPLAGEGRERVHSRPLHGDLNAGPRASRLTSPQPLPAREREPFVARSEPQMHRRAIAARSPQAHRLSRVPSMCSVISP